MKVNELIMLARVMSQRYGVDVRVANTMNTASCSQRYANGKYSYVITLPLLKDKGKFDRMVRGYLDHELGHVQYTDWPFFNEKVKQVNCTMRCLWNIFEDVYVETRMGDAFPGSRANLSWLARHIFTPQMAYDEADRIKSICHGSSSLYIVVMDFIECYCLFKRRAWADNKLAHSDALLNSVRDALVGNDVNIAEAFEEIDDALAQPANSTQETYELADRVCKAINVMAQKCRNKNWDNLVLQREQRAEDEKRSKNAGEQIGDATKKAKDNAFEKDENGNYKKRKSVPFNAGVEDALTAMSQLGLDGAEQADMGTNNALAVSSVMRDVTGLDVLSRSEALFQDAFPDMTKQIGCLQSGFMRTLPGLLQSVQYKPCKTGYAGRLSGRDLYKAGVGNGRIFSRKAERKEQRIDVAILLDASGSMCGDIYSAQIVLYAMLGMLKSLPKVRSYGALFSDEIYQVVSGFGNKRLTEYRMYRANGGTPTGGAVVKAMSAFSTESDVRRVLFVITDGIPSDVQAFIAAVEIAHSQGFELYGIGLNASIRQMEDHFGEDNVVRTKDISELPGKLAAMMQKALMKAVA